MIPLSEHSAGAGTAVERLPLRVEAGLSGLLGMTAGELEVCAGDPGDLPALRCRLPAPVRAGVSLVIRVHSRAGIPLAFAAVDVNPGDQTIEAPRLTMLAMEGYAHLRRSERLLIESRVWSRRAFATGSAV